MDILPKTDLGLFSSLFSSLTLFFLVSLDQKKRKIKINRICRNKANISIGIKLYCRMHYIWCANIRIGNCRMPENIILHIVFPAEHVTCFHNPLSSPPSININAITITGITDIRRVTLTSNQAYIFMKELV